MEKTRVQAVIFLNWTKEDFTHTWDNVPYTFPAGEKMMLEDHLARHFAKHLATREVYKEKKILSGITYKEYYNRCLPAGKTFEADDSQKLNTDIANDNSENEKSEAENDEKEIDPEAEDAEEKKLTKDLNKLSKPALLEKAKTDLNMEFEENEPNKADLIGLMVPRYLASPDKTEGKSSDEKEFEGAQD